MNTERNCQTCKYYKDGYCENLELKPYYPQEGCEDYEIVKHAVYKSFDDPCDIVDFINEHEIKKENIVGIVRRDSICLWSNLFRYYLIYFEEEEE